TRGSDTAADHRGEVTLPRKQGRCQPALALGRREVDISLHCDPRRMRLALPRLAHPRRWLLGLYVASAALVTVREGILTPSNNFRVFRAATRNLLAGHDLYAAHPEQHFDYYKYSPTFALLFAPLALVHPRPWRFGALFLAVATLLVALPLVAVPAAELAAQYRSWRAIEATDTLNRGYSLMQYLYMWSGADWPVCPVQLAGTALLVAPRALGRAHWPAADFRR